MVQVNISDVEAELSSLVRRVEHGETVTICRDGKPVAVLGPPPPPKDRVLGRLAGVFTVPDDFDDPLPEDIQAAFEGRAD